MKDEQQRICPEGCGTLPECAPLSVPFVPFQQEGEKKYGKTDALAQGTLFPGLNLPFHLQVKGEPVPKTPLSELQALSFVLTELGLYLDTHPEDKEAFQLFQKYAALEKEGSRTDNIFVAISWVERDSKDRQSKARPSREAGL